MPFVVLQKSAASIAITWWNKGVLLVYMKTISDLLVYILWNFFKFEYLKAE